MSGSKKKAERRANIAEMGMTEKQKRELKEAQDKRRNTILATIGGVVVAVLVAALLIWHSGVFARHTVAVKFDPAAVGASGESTLTVADMEYFYNLALNTAYSQEQSMAQLYSQYGMEYTPSFDPSSDLKTQYIDDEQTTSYYDYFVSQAKANATQVLALSNAAKAAGYTLSEDAQSSLDSAGSDLDAQVSQYGFANRDSYLKAVYGRNMTEKIYFKNLERNILASDYYAASTADMGDYSEAELKAYYDENSAELDSYDYEYVYFDGTPQTETGEDGDPLPATDEEKAAALAEAKSKAEALVNAVATARNETAVDDATGEAVVKTFAQLAQEQEATSTNQTQKAGSTFSGAPYADWLTGGDRKDGDTDLFEVEGAGYYVVQFHSRYLYNEPTVDVRHILLSTAMDDDPDTEDVDESKEPTEAHIAEIKDQAQSVLDQFLAGDKTPDSFGELAEEHSQDGRDEDGNLYTPGGLYEGVKVGDMVQPFEDWCFDASRQEGDTGLVQTTFGWHVMYFQGVHRPMWMDSAESAKQTADQQAFLDSVTAGYKIVSGSWAKLGMPETEPEA